MTSGVIVQSIQLLIFSAVPITEFKLRPAQLIRTSFLYAAFMLGLTVSNKGQRCAAEVPVKILIRSPWFNNNFTFLYRDSDCHLGDKVWVRIGFYDYKGSVWLSSFSFFCIRVIVQFRFGSTPISSYQSG